MKLRDITVTILVAVRVLVLATILLLTGPSACVGLTQPLTQTQIDNTAMSSSVGQVLAADIDGDGVNDFVSSSPYLVWFPGGSGFGQKLTIYNGSVVHPTGCIAVDLDGDGDNDIVVVTLGVVYWFESSGGSLPVWKTHTVVNSSLSFTALTVAAVDLDGDDDMDLVVSGSPLQWLESDGRSPPLFAAHAVGTGPAVVVATADLDADGDVDIVAASSVSIVWHENDGRIPLSFTPHSVIGAPIGNPVSLATADLNGDGLPDFVLCGASGGMIQWFTLYGLGQTYAARAVGSACTFNFGAVPSDFDGDGDVDVVVACWNGSSSAGGSQVFW